MGVKTNQNHALSRQLLHSYKSHIRLPQLHFGNSTFIIA